LSTLGRGFDSVADLYDDVRPDYPDELYDAVEAVRPLDGAVILDLAAGTGIATRALRRHGARVVALEPGEPMLRRLRAVSHDVSGVVAHGEEIPFRDNVFDLVACATAWHWLDADRSVAEARRVLKPGGHLALWWANHRWGDGVEWEDAQSAVYERWQTAHGSRPPGDYGVLPRDAAADLRRRGIHVVVETKFFWSRERSRADHIRAIATHSDTIALGDRQQAFLDEVTEALAPWDQVTERLWGPLVIARL
jgi:SAM-dependent methyltransferase